MNPDTFAALVAACTAALESVDHGEAGMRVVTYGPLDGSHTEWFRVWHTNDEKGTVTSSVCAFPYGEGVDSYIVQPYIQTNKGGVGGTLRAEAAWCNRVHKAIHKALLDFRKAQKAEEALARLALARAA